MPTFAEIEPLSLSDRVINALKDAFFAGELKPGDAIVERELARQMMQKLAEAVTRQQPNSALAGLLFWCTLNLRAQDGVFKDCPPLEEIVLLEHVADLAVRSGHLRAVDEYGAFRRCDNAGYQGEQGALAASAWPDDRDELAGNDRQRDVLEGFGFAFKHEVAQSDIA